MSHNSLTYYIYAFLAYFNDLRHFNFSFMLLTGRSSVLSGFNAAVAGCFFAVESVLWPSPDSAVSLTNTTSMVILSAVIASVLSEVGLGAQPAFKVPSYDFRSASGKLIVPYLSQTQTLLLLTIVRCGGFALTS